MPDIKEDFTYDQGYIDGLTAYAHWLDGVQIVGTCGTTLKIAIERRKTTYNYKEGSTDGA